jgi:hypothetical protein
VKKLMCTAVAVGCIVAGSMTQAVSTEAAPPLKVVKIFFDSPGSPDNKLSNTSLNGEYFVVKNMTTKALNLKGWKVSDAQAHVYVFPSFTLAAGASVAVRSGTGTANATNLYWKFGNFIWNNDTDTATLLHPAGTVVHRCKYPNSAGGVKIVGTTAASGKYALCP